MKTGACGGHGPLKTVLSTAIVLVLFANAPCALAQSSAAPAQPAGDGASMSSGPSADAQTSGTPNPASSPSTAKETPTQLSDVVVTYRASLEKAMDLKRESVGIVI